MRRFPKNRINRRQVLNPAGAVFPARLAYRDSFGARKLGIWATAGIGLALGSGMYCIGIFVTVLIAVFQFVMHRFTIGADSFTTNRLRFTVHDDGSFDTLLSDQLKSWNAKILSSGISREGEDLVSYDLTLKMPRNSRRHP